MTTHTETRAKEAFEKGYINEWELNFILDNEEAFSMLSANSHALSMEQVNICKDIKNKMHQLNNELDLKKDVKQANLLIKVATNENNLKNKKTKGKCKKILKVLPILENIKNGEYTENMLKVMNNVATQTGFAIA